jgi:nitrous-oxide reductase
VFAGTFCIGAAALLIHACSRPSGKASSVLTGDAASKVYVAPGSYDEFYSFLSGGFSGQVAVYGLPSGRLLKVIPVFSQNAENGWGYNEETKPMLQTTFGFIPWDDTHHTELSMTDGVPDGRWLFINGNNTPRIARIDLTRFETDEIPQRGRRTRIAVHDTGHEVCGVCNAVQCPRSEHRCPH